MNKKKLSIQSFSLRSICKLFALILLILIKNQTYGQDGIDYPFYRAISTKHFNKEQFKLNQEFESTWREYETHHLNERENHKIKPDGYTLTIVFHAMYTNDIEKVKSDVEIQLNALNRDFGSPNPVEYKEGDSGLSFSLLAETPNIMFKLYNNNNATLISEGISAVSNIDKQWQTFDDFRRIATGDIKAIIPDKVINVWIVKLNDKLGSFAQIPGGIPETDGIVIDHRTFGAGTAPYNQGKTLTHLIGNYLGLMDLWGVYPCQDDGVVDTPVHNSPNYIFPNSRHISTCPGAQVEMTMNFMDNMADAHMWIFTKGQVERLHFMLNEGGPRHHLIK